MKRHELVNNLKQCQKWLERSILALSAEGAWKDADKSYGDYLASWLKKPGHGLSGQHIIKGRAMALRYVEELMKIALKRTAERIEVIDKQRVRLVKMLDILTHECDGTVASGTPPQIGEPGYAEWSESLLKDGVF
jgi:hypothetical protein